ncbi:hypothetical protein C8R46DRAFT_1107927 [Mycena filopes]|nr:hypothetical protein C8R46DRAFT_1107927 [Mycena filopes]
MPGILDLAAELLHEVYLMVPWEDKRVLRSACRRLDSALGPLVLSHMLISVAAWRGTPEQLALLASPTYGGASCVKCLTIERFAAEEQAEIDDEVLIQETQEIRELLAPALRALKNLRHVNWALDNRDIGGVSTIILDALTTLEISHLGITIPESLPLAIPFNRFQNLRSISLNFAAGGGRWAQILERIVHPLAEAIKNSPNLESITVLRDEYDHDVYRMWDDEPDPRKDEQRPCFNHLVSLENPSGLINLVLRSDIIDIDKITRSHLGSLRSLTLELPGPTILHGGYHEESVQQFYAPAADVVRLWRRLADEEIFPRAFCTTAPVDHAAVEYMKAHPGIRRLELSYIPRPFGPDDFDHVYANIFYTEVLPRHAATLTHLTITSGRRGPWAVTVQSARAVLQCRALRFLSMELNLPRRAHNIPNVSDSEAEDIGGDKVRIDHMLLILDVALELQSLTTLQLAKQPGYAEPMGKVCGTGRMRASREWRSLTRVAAHDFCALTATPSPDQQSCFLLRIVDDTFGDYLKLYRLKLAEDGGWRLTEVLEAGADVVHVPGGGSGINRSFVESLPPRKRLSIEELYSV